MNQQRLRTIQLQAAIIARYYAPARNSVPKAIPIFKHLEIELSKLLCWSHRPGKTLVGPDCPTLRQRFSAIKMRVRWEVVTL